jgi:uncharacterized protein with FMN-binding domain
MKLFLNFGFAWVSVFLTIALCIVYVLRKAIVKTKGKSPYLIKMNKSLRKHHKLIGILLVATGLIHGYFSSEKVLSLNWGTVSWVVTILLGLNWMARKALAKYKGWIYYHRVLTAIFLLTIVVHVVDVGGIQVFNVLSGKGTVSGQKVSVSNFNKQVQGATFKDGTYTGEANGYRPGLQVSVEIKNNTITSIEILQHNEVNARFYQRAINAIPQEILNAQSTDVDTVSGATFTSTGIINAVNNALSKALISGTLPDAKQLPQNRGHGGGRDRGPRGNGFPGGNRVPGEGRRL